MTITRSSSGGIAADEQIRDVIAAALVSGSNITITPNDGADTITISAASGITTSTVTTKGDVIAATGNAAVSRVGVGSNGQVLTATSSAGAGVSWTTVSGVAGANTAADNTWTGNQKFTSSFGGGQSTVAGVYPTMGGGNPGIELATGTENWRIDNQAGTLRFLKASVASVITFDFSGNIIAPGVITCDRAAIGSTSSGRHPVPILITMDGSTFDGGTPSADKVAQALTVVFQGGFSGEASRGLVNPGWLWGANDFITSGATSGDLSGIQDFEARLTEVHVNAPGAALNTLSALHAESNVNATATGATVGAAYAVRVNGVRVNGGTVTDAYSLFVGPNSTTGTGSITGTNKSLYVSGNSQLDGALTLSSITTTTSASSGGASALPGTPAGYLTINIGGINRKFPYYA